MFGVFLLGGSYFDPQPTFKVIQIILAIIGTKYEGVRIVQIPFYVGLILPAALSSLFAFAAQKNFSFEPVFYLGTLISISGRANYGTNSFQKFGEPTGPFEVGYRKTFLLENGSNACSIYYPVVKGTPAGSSKPVMIVEQGEDQIASIKKVVKFVTKDHRDLPDVFVVPSLATTVPVLSEAEVVGEVVMTPLVFSHGMGVNRMMYSGLFREFASYGLLVVVIDH